MKYMARRPGVNGAWLSRDVEIEEVQRTRTLSGPSTINGKMDGDLARRIMPDGLPFIEDDGTMIYAVSETTGRIVNCGLVVPPTNYEEACTFLAAGYSAYPKGLIYLGARNWGPQPYQPATDAVLDEDGVTVVQPPLPELPGIPRPMTLGIVQDLWAYVAQTYTDLGVVLAGDLDTGGVYTGTNAEPYRLQFWDSPDIGEQIENLALETPFDWVENPMWIDAGVVPPGDPWGSLPYTGDGLGAGLAPRAYWPAGYGSTQHDVRHFVRYGYPRLGRLRDDLRFVIGENITIPPPVTTSPRANVVLGIGNGDPGPQMATARSAIEDGRVKRVAVITDKTADQNRITGLVNNALRDLNARPTIESIGVIDHRNARLSAIELGDDILVRGDHPQYGHVNTVVRVLTITEGNHEDAAVLSVRESTQFTYSGARGATE